MIAIQTITLLVVCITLTSALNSELKEYCDDRAGVLIDEFDGKTYAEMKQGAVEFFKKCIIDLFELKMLPNVDDKDKTNFVQFKRLPTFEEADYMKFSPRNYKFGIFAKIIQMFLKKAEGWNKMASDAFMKSSDGLQLKCKNLLYVVGARHAYYTHILWSASDKFIKQCHRTDSGNIVPPNSVCYPMFPTSLKCTSPAKIGLIGKDAAETVKRFRDYMKSLTCSSSAGVLLSKGSKDEVNESKSDVDGGKNDVQNSKNDVDNGKSVAEGGKNAIDSGKIGVDSSRNDAKSAGGNTDVEPVTEVSCKPEVMLDTKILVESFQLATPELFESPDPDEQHLLQGVKHVLNQLDKSQQFQWLDIILAMVKIYSDQNTGSFTDGFEQIITETKDNEIAGYSIAFLKAVKENNVEEKSSTYDKLIQYVRKDLGKSLTKGKAEDLIFKDLESHIGFTNSYRSLGATRIDETIDMKLKLSVPRLSLNDYVASALENYGCAHTSISKCSETSYICLASASDYLWRAYASLKAAKDILVDIGKSENLSEESKVNIKRSRDYFAELLFIFKLNKEIVPENYFSPQAYKEEVNFDDDNKEKIQPKVYEAGSLQKKYLNCESKEECLKVLENTLHEYTKSTEQYKKTSKKHIVDKTVNSRFFTYVTNAPNDIESCYKDFKMKKPEMCGLKTAASDEST